MCGCSRTPDSKDGGRRLGRDEDGEEDGDAVLELSEGRKRKDDRAKQGEMDGR